MTYTFNEFEPAFRAALDLLDAGDTVGLHEYLVAHPQVVRDRVNVEAPNYFKDSTLLQFVAENPIRRGTLPSNIAAGTRVILEAGAKDDQASLDKTLMLVCSGRVTRECGVQEELIDLLCGAGADPDAAAMATLAHGEFAALERLLAHGATFDLVIAAGLGRLDLVQNLIGAANALARHRALAAAAQFGHTEVVRLLLDAGENPNRFNPDGFHAHSTPLHQATAGGHEETVRLLVERGARLDCRDTLWNGTPLGWASHEGKMAVERYLRAQEGK